MLARPLYNVNLSGFVEAREERERTDRITIRVYSIDAPRADQQLERVRLSVKKGTAPPVGAYVALKARLSPPLQPRDLRRMMPAMIARNSPFRSMS